MSKTTTKGLLTTLPYFRIYPDFKPPTEKISTNMIPAKPKRKKKLDVPVHTSNRKDINESQRKTYSAQFNGRSKHKHRYNEIAEAPTKDSDGYTFFNSNLEVVETEVNKIKKKVLIESHERIYSEYQLMVQKLHETQDFFSKKVVKLKDKLDATRKVNEEIAIENSAIKNQYENLLLTLNDFKVHLGDSRHMNGKLEEALERNKRDTDELKEENKNLTEDTNMLKNVVYRLNVQMERYQGKKDQMISLASNQLYESIANLESNNARDETNTLLESHRNHSHIPISWGSVNSHTIGPLLDAYQETISEKEDIIENYEREMSQFSIKLKEIVNENESLHKRLTSDDACSIKLKEELERVGLELKNVKEQNDLLIKKCALKQDKLEEVLRCYELKVEQVKRDYNVAADQYHKSKIEISSLNARIKSMSDFQSDFKNERQNYIPVAVHTASVNECKQLYEELKKQYEIEKQKLKDNQIALENTIAELTQNISTLKSEKDDLNKKIELHGKQIKKFEGKSTDLKHVLHETQLSRTACKKQLNKAMEFAKELVSEQEKLLQVLQQRQLENKAVKQIGSDIASRMDTLKSKLKSVQRGAWQELSTVERRIQEQDSVIETLKREHDQEVERLKQIIQHKQKEENLLLKNSNASIPLPHYLLLKDRNMN